MLGKLFKHEFIATRRMYLPLYLLLLVLTPVFSLLFRLGIKGATTPVNTILSTLGIAGFVLTMLALMVASCIFIVMHFYRTTATSEAFLTFTLPAKPHQILIAKLVTASIWQILSTVMAFVAIFSLLLISGTLNLHDIASARENMIQLISISGIPGSSTALFVFLMLAIFVIGTPCGILLYYFAIMLGQLFNDHRVIASIAMYGAITFVIQFVSMFLSFPITSSMEETIDSTNAAIAFVQTMNTTLLLSLILCIIMGIISFIGTIFIMKKKLNVRI